MPAPSGWKEWYIEQLPPWATDPEPEAEWFGWPIPHPPAPATFDDAVACIAAALAPAGWQLVESSPDTPRNRAVGRAYFARGQCRDPRRDGFQPPTNSARVPGPHGWRTPRL